MNLKDFVADYPQEKIITWKMRKITEDSRIYFKPNIYEDDKDYSGFHFVIVSWCGSSSDEDMWENPDIEVEYHGTAYFDGMRHMYQGSEETHNKGYLYYPSMKDHIKFFEVLLELTREYCLGFGDDYEYYNLGR